MATHVLIDTRFRNQTIQIGETVPSGTFSYVKWGPELEDKLACGVPTTLSTDAFKGKKVVIISVPGAFTVRPSFQTRPRAPTDTIPTCHVNHLPPYLAKIDELKSKGVDHIYVLAANDAFVMSGWAIAQGLKDKITAISDTYAKWSESMGLTLDLTGMGLGVRTARYVLILDDLKVVSVEKEPGPGLTNTDVDTTLSKL
ncbi:hypothetical protein FRB90_007880 [Tulasnella sp. 427]|nr:hypothetical protein FRB90_007880 [Tulasnella sp. 427]